jgi:hypothetical protein
MANEPINQMSGPIAEGGDGTAGPVPDPALEASLIARSPDEVEGDASDGAAPDPFLTVPEAPPGSGPAKRSRGRSRLLSLFHRSGRAPQGPGLARTETPVLTTGLGPDLIGQGPDMQNPELSGSPPDTFAHQEADPDGEAMPSPDVTLTGTGPAGTSPDVLVQAFTGPLPEAKKETESRVSGALARLFGRKRADPTLSGTFAPPPQPALPERPATEADVPAGAAAPSGPQVRERGASGRAASRKGSGPGRRGFPPLQVLIGWVGESSRRDVLQHARGFATDHLETLETAWIAMAEFRDGTLFEVHEGGSGQAYLPELIETISRDPDQVLWVPSGTKLNRVVTFSIVEGRPFSMMLNEADSARVRASGQVPVERTGRMRRLSPRGNAVLVIGATLFAASLTALSASAFLASRVDQQPVPSLSYNAEILPHGQIVSLSDALREDRWVSRILFENGAWRAEFETFEDLVLPDETGAAQRVIDEALAREEILRSERERKVRELEAQ